MAESEEELKNFLMQVKEENEKGDLKPQHSENKDHGIWSQHCMANRWVKTGNSDNKYNWARTRHGTIDWLKLGEEYNKAVYLSPDLSNLYAECIM